MFFCRSIAPLVESVRCLLFFPFDALVIRPWLTELSPPSHLGPFISASIDALRLLHVASVVLWLVLWYRTVAAIPVNGKLEGSLFAPMGDKSTLLKEDKCISACAYSNNINVINVRRPWQNALYVLLILFSLTCMWFTFALRFEHCNELLKSAVGIDGRTVVEL